jgi:hypothetical protein
MFGIPLGALIPILTGILVSFIGGFIAIRYGGKAK